jgi:hypothetical protein
MKSDSGYGGVRRSVRWHGWLALAMLVALSSRVRAADGPVRVTFTVATLALTGDLAEMRVPLASAGAAAGRRWLDVKLNENGFTGPYQYHGVRLLRFYGRQDPPGEALAEAKLPEGVTKLILVLFPKAGGYSAIAVPEAESPEGSFFLMNTSPFPVSIELAGRREILKPGGRASMAGGRGADQEVRIHAVVDGKATLIRSTSWRLDANQREMVFFHTPPGTTHVVAKHLMATSPEPENSAR